MSARQLGARAVTTVIGTPPVEAFGRRRWAVPLRVIDYHEITDAAAFAAQVDLIADRYAPVSEAQVLEAYQGGRPLPRHAVWVTFDDGSPSVIDVALPILARRSVPATFYVCPGLIEDQSAPWWDVIAAAGAGGAGAEVAGRELRGMELVRALKHRPDAERRAVLADLRDEGNRRLGPEARAVSLESLDRWVDAGNEVGNHTWDHPCLHQCPPEVQRDQIVRAHEWLLRYRPDHRPSFAYPNGDHTDHAEGVLDELDCGLALLSDHRLASVGASPLRVGRLRLDASAGLGRARAVLSGVHSAGYHWALRWRLTGPAVLRR